MFIAAIRSTSRCSSTDHATNIYILKPQYRSTCSQHLPNTRSPSARIRACCHLHLVHAPSFPGAPNVGAAGL
jgi:hypothetical protein